MKLKSIILAMTVMLLSSVSAGGYYLYYVWNNAVEDSIREHTESTVELLHSELNLYFKNQRKPVKTLANMPAIKDVLLNNTAQNLQQANHILDTFCTTLETLTCYLMDIRGTTIASSNRHSKKSFVGKNYSFRPYFKNAVSGESSVYLALGVTSKKRGTYFSHQVILDNKPIGVVVIKVSVSALEKKLSNSRDIIALTGPDGMVFAASQHQWLFKSLWPLSAEKAELLVKTRQFGDKLPGSVGLAINKQGRVIDASANTYSMRQKEVSDIPGWNISLFHDSLLTADHQSEILNRMIAYSTSVLFLLIAMITLLLNKFARKEIRTRKQAEQRLQQSEHRYKTLLDTATDAFFLHNMKGKFVDVNQEACHKLGYSRDELLNMSVSDIELSSDNDKLISFWRDLEKGEKIQLEGLHRRKDSTTFPVEVSLGLVQMDNENLISVLARDVTERKQGEEIVRNAQQRMALHFQQTLFGVIEWDTGFCVTEWNTAAEKIFGYSREEAINQHAKKLIIPDNIMEHVDAIWERLLTSEDSVRNSNENITKDGRVILCDWYNTPLVNDSGEVIGVASLVQDVTEQKQVQQKLQESESNYRSLFEMSDDANMTLDQNGFIDCNQATLEMFGCASKQEFLGKHPGEFSPPLQADGADSLTAANERIATAYKQGKNFFEWTHRRADGDDFPAEVLLTPMNLAGKNVVQAIVRDITGRKQAEQSLIRVTEEARRASQAKSKFLSRMSHELRTPMHAILGFGQLLELQSTKFTKQQNAHITEILNAGYHLLELINEVLDLTSIEAGKMEVTMHEVAVDKLLQQCIKLISTQAEARDMELVNQLSGKGYIVLADDVRLKQVLLNLLTNAVKYSQQHGRITIHAVIIADERLRLCVSDEGAGLSEKSIAKLFTPFERLNPDASIQGTGIGLVITKHLVELMGGSVGVESVPGKGSTFWVELAMIKAVS